MKEEIDPNLVEIVSKLDTLPKKDLRYRVSIETINKTYEYFNLTPSKFKYIKEQFENEKRKVITYIISQELNRVIHIQKSHIVAFSYEFDEFDEEIWRD